MYMYVYTHTHTHTYTHTYVYIYTYTYTHTHTHIYTGDNTKLVRATGWTPTIEFKETVQAVLDYWRREVKLRFQLI
jgi:nucleoside-diphosphate-sugar epimerase